ncbi:exostosin family-domain-containing protein [Hyaloraphidium curvatum]|nr:exostosin family-domain-containing protein [Hyaloraphidium curvatum]
MWAGRRGRPAWVPLLAAAVCVAVPLLLGRGRPAPVSAPRNGVRRLADLAPALTAGPPCRVALQPVPEGPYPDCTDRPGQPLTALLLRYHGHFLARRLKGAALRLGALSADPPDVLLLDAERLNLCHLHMKWGVPLRRPADRFVDALLAPPGPPLLAPFDHPHFTLTLKQNTSRIFVLAVEPAQLPEAGAAAADRHILVPYSAPENPFRRPAEDPDALDLALLTTCRHGPTPSQDLTPGKAHRRRLVAALRRAAASAPTPERVLAHCVCESGGCNASLPGFEDEGYLQRHTSYAESQREIASATFCPVPIGDTPSSRRLSDAVLAGCIPVFVSSPDAEMHVRPWGDLVDYRDFAVHVRVDPSATAPHAAQPGPPPNFAAGYPVPSFAHILPLLRSIPPGEVLRLKRGVRAHVPYFRGSPVLGDADDWTEPPESEWGGRGQYAHEWALATACGVLGKGEAGKIWGAVGA